MTRRESIIAGFGITSLLAIIIIITLFVCTHPKKEVSTEETVNKGLMIDGHAVEVVYDQYDAAYLKYVIGPQKIIYIPLPSEAEVDDYSDSLQFYYTKTQSNGKFNNKRAFN